MNGKGMGWVVVAAIIVLGGWYFLSSEADPNVDQTGSPGGVPGVVVLKVRAEAGRFTPSEVSVNRGDEVIIEFTAVDDKYDFSFVDPKIGFDVITEPGMTQVFGFETVEREPGRYPFKCFEFCPRGEMGGILEIRP